MKFDAGRRRFIAGGAAGCAGLVLASASGKRRRTYSAAPRRSGRADVFIARQTSYSSNIYETVRRSLAAHRLDVRGKRVVLKPNLVEFEPGSVINTNPLLVHAALEAFRSMGAANVRIAEGPGHRRITLDLAEAAGYFDIVPGFADLFTDLNLDAVSKRNLSTPRSKLNSLYLPHTALGADLLVSMPKMKTHHWAVATLSMKNFFGLVPGGVYGWPKNVLHWAGIPECIADIGSLFPGAFAIVDGVMGMEGNGPIQGTPKSAGVIVTGGDLSAVDATCCRIMGIDPVRVEYLRLARHRADIQPDAIRQIGETLASVQTHFALLPQFEFARLKASQA